MKRFMGGRRTAAVGGTIAVLAAAAFLGLADRNGTTVAAGTPETRAESCSADLEQLVQEEAAALGDRFAGSTQQPDGTVTFRVTDGEAPSCLRNHPQVHVITARHSTDRLEVVSETVATRLNALLAPGGQRLSSGAWPWEAEVDVDQNAVLVTVDTSQRFKDKAIRAALVDELKAGTVKLAYGQVQPVVYD